MEAQIKRNQEIIDTVQAYAIQMADLASDFNELTIWHVNEVADFIARYQQIAEVVIPLLQRFNIPGANRIGQIVDNKYVVKAEALSTSILLTTNEAKEIIEKIQRALHNADLEPLKEYLDQVKELDQKLQGLLKTADSS